MTEEGESFEFSFKKGTILYEMKQLEGILKQIHEIADMALKQRLSLEPNQVDVSKRRYNALLEIRGLSK